MLPNVSSPSQAAQRGMVQAHIRLCMTGHNSGYLLMPNFNLFFSRGGFVSLARWGFVSLHPSPKEACGQGSLDDGAACVTTQSSEVFSPMVRNRGHTAYVTFFLPYASLLFVSIHP